MRSLFLARPSPSCAESIDHETWWVQRTRRRIFVQLPLTFLCELCAFARDNAFHVFPRQLGLGRCSICFSQRRKARKENSKAKSRQSRSFANSQRPTKSKFPERRKARKGKAKAKNANPEAFGATRPDMQRKVKNQIRLALTLNLSKSKRVALLVLPDESVLGW